MVKTTLTIILLAATILAPGSVNAASLLFSNDGVPQSEAATTLVVRAPQSTTHGRTLVPFAQASDRFELSGETDTQEFTFWATGKDVAGGGNLVIAYKNAVSVLPDAAEMRIEVNGKPLANFPIRSPFDVTPKKIALAPGTLNTGNNVVRIFARQRHRVDCSLDATYELWTRLDPAISGFEPAVATSYSTFEDLHAAGRMDGGTTELRLVLPASADAAMLNDAMPIVQALALYLNREDMIVTVADRPGDGPGIDLFVDTGSQTTDISGTAPFGVTIRNSTDQGRVQVIFRASGKDQLENLLLEALRGPMNAGLKARGQTTYGVVHANADSTFALKDAGIRSAAFSGRLMRTHFDMVMPADFYPADYATLNINLSAATAPGLDPASQLLIRVNDRVVNSFPFRNTDGQNFDGKLIELPLRAFRPGVNKVEMLAELPAASDKICAPETRDESHQRFILLGDTTFSVPALARVTRLPDLAAFAGNAYPFNDGKPFTIFLDHPGSASASAAMTIAARLALAAGQPIKGEVRFSAPSADVLGNAIVISAGEEAADASMPGDAFRVDDRAASMMKADLLATATVPTMPAAVQPQVSGEDQLMKAFEHSNAENSSERSWSARFRELLNSASARFGSWLSYQDDQSEPLVPSDGALLTVAQTPRIGDQGSITYVRAANSDDLSKGIRQLVEPGNWRALNGGAALIAAKSLLLVSFPADRHHFDAVTDQSFGNYRRIAAAWFSDNFQFYVALVILLIGLFAAWLGKIVPGRGVRTDK
jgi:hypothetical protein